jgi:hypothetical protein
MKIRVSVSIKANSEENTTLDLVARPSETVASVKEKVAGARLIPYTEQELSLDGVILADESKLSACGVAEGSCVKFEVKATEATLAQQLSELLQARDLSSDELGLLYCYKYGANISQALKLIGFGMTLQDFINKQKSLSMENGSVKIVRTDTALKPFSVVEELVQILKDCDSDALEIKDLCAKFVQKFGVQLSSLTGGRAGDFLAKEKATFVLHGRHGSRVSLLGEPKKAKGGSPRSIASADTIDVPPGLGDEGPPGLGEVAAPPGLGGEISSSSDEEEAEISATVYNQQFQELHSRIHSGSSKVTQRINDLVGAISDASFLDIDHVVIGGSAGKGTSISGLATAEVVLFAQGLPLTSHDSWYAPLLQAIAGTIANSEEVQMEHAIESVRVEEDYIKISMDSPITIVVYLHVSPVFESYRQTLQIMGEQGPDARSFFAPSLAKEHTQFVGRQPSAVKETIRLMKWWRNQQEWYGKLARPSDLLLELVAIYSALKTKPTDQNEAIANLMSLLSRFGEMRVVWSNYYGKSDVSAPLLLQRPLLMDPTNPFVNVADPEHFDATELSTLARSTHFFW